MWPRWQHSRLASRGPRSLSMISLGQHNRYIAADLMGYCDGIYPLVMTNIAMV